MNTSTKLQVVNSLLTSIGEDPVNTLGTGLDDEIVAESIVDEVTRKVLIRGWSWNTEESFKIVRQADDTITVPSNFLSIDFHNTNLVLRGNRIYDKQNNSYKLQSDVTCSTVIVGLPWEEIPEAARQFILYSAGRIFQQRQVGSRTLYEFSLKDESEAWATLTGNEEATSNLSIFQNQELALMTDRSSGRAVVDYMPGSIFGSIS